MTLTNDPLETAHHDRSELVRILELEIVLGRLHPRERLVEDDLMARLGAKRHQVRAALSELEQLGLVERRPNRGAAVRKYDAAEVEELTDLRAQLHRLAVERMALPFGDDAVAALDALATRHEKAVEDGAFADVIIHNDAFHDLLFGFCNNRFLAASITKHGLISRAFRSYRIGDPVLLRQAAQEHRAMVEAAANGARDALADLVVRHIQPSKQLYLERETGDQQDY